ncbi:MAG TPA: hypothetical protein VNO55_21220 [Polyangia bacterium]|nr:hypothetical protein [Polyangia bacterium]
MKKMLVMAPLLALVVWGAGRAAAADKNKCGCYKDDAGLCFCDKKAKCGCPGDCEPKGCEQARDKRIQKEIEAETKKAAQADRKHTRGESKAAPTTESTPTSSPRKLTSAQAKELVRLLDLYFAGNSDARTRSAEDVRKDLLSR